jgi:hypothetical protein
MVSVMRICTGETVIGSVEEKGDFFFVKKPVMIVPVGKQEFGMAPWLPFAKEESVAVSKINVVYCVEANADLSNEYNANFGSGLVMPTGGIKPASLKITE